MIYSEEWYDLMNELMDEPKGYMFWHMLMWFHYWQYGSDVQ